MVAKLPNGISPNYLMTLTCRSYICYIFNEMREYKRRIADVLLAEKLAYMGAVLVRGAKWCGKTTTSKQIVRSSVFLADARKGVANRLLAQQRPDRLLKGAYPRLIDEWQEVPSLWDAVRAAVDDAQDRGLFVLTGSAVPPRVDEEDARREIRHTGTGRIARLTMRPMTIWESGDAKGTISFADLFDTLRDPLRVRHPGRHDGARLALPLLALSEEYLPQGVRIDGVDLIEYMGKETKV